MCLHSKAYASYAILRPPLRYSLREIVLFIGWFNIVAGFVLLIVNILLSFVFKKGSLCSWVDITRSVFIMAVGALELIGVKEADANLLWAAVYMELIYAGLLLIGTILHYITCKWIMGIIDVLELGITIYFFLIVRSYAYELEAAATDVGQVPNYKDLIKAANKNL